MDETPIVVDVVEVAPRTKWYRSNIALIAFGVVAAAAFVALKVDRCDACKTEAPPAEDQ